MNFLKNTTSKKVVDLHDAELDQRQRKTFQRLDDCPKNSFKKIWKFQKPSVKKFQKSCQNFLNLLNRQAHFQFTEVN